MNTDPRINIDDHGGTKKRGGTTAGKGHKRKANEEQGSIRTEDQEVGAPRVSYFEEKKETELLRADIDKRRQHHQSVAPPIESPHLLSGWRVIQEIKKQKRAKRFDAPDPDHRALDVIQSAFRIHSKQILEKAMKIARHRIAGAQRPDGFVSTSEPRKGLGDIRKKDESTAERKAAEEREKLLKAAGSKRADEETRERAQRARAEIAGQQQALAANKALAAALGGDDVQWANWDAAGASKSSVAAAAGSKELPKESGKGKGEARVSKSTKKGGGDGDTTMLLAKDIVAALEEDPFYCKSGLLYGMLNEY